MATVVEELIGFLSAPSLPVRKIAVSSVRDLTGSEDGFTALSEYSNTLLPSLSNLLAGKQEFSEPAAEALVNLSQDSNLAAKMIDLGLIKTTMNLLFNPSSSITSLLVMLLVNITHLDSGILALLQVDDEKIKGLFMMKLIRSFCRTSGENKEEPFDHVASILVNVSKKEEGRKMLIDAKLAMLKQILQQSNSTNPLRTKGVYGTIRNCCFEAENHLADLLSLSEFLWPALLLPVAGTKVYSKEDTQKMPQELSSVLSIVRSASHDAETRIDALEAIYLIVLQECGLKAFWKVNGPRILQEGYAEEQDAKVMEAYERVGSLIVDSSGSLEVTDNDS